MNTSLPQLLVRDVTDAPGAIPPPLQAPDYRAELANLGFTRVGLLECRAPGAVNPEVLRQHMSAEDVDLIVKGSEQGQIDEILTSPDGRAFATAEPFFGGPVICMRTVLQDGTIVETVTRPVRRPELPAGSSPSMSLTKALIGPLPVWSRENRPGDGYHVEVADTRDAGALWQRHRQRVDEIAFKRNAAVPPQDNLPLYLSTLLRWEHLTRHRRRQVKFLIYGFIGALLLLEVVVVFSGRAITGLLSGTYPWLLRAPVPIAPLLLMLALPLLSLPIMSIVWRVIVPRLPGPPQESLPALLQAVRDEYGIT